MAKVKHDEANDVKNVHEEVDETKQLELEKKAKGLMDYMNEEPAARLIPTIRATEQGILPDVKIVLVDKKEEDDSSTGDEAVDSPEVADSSNEAGATESTKS